MLEVDDIPARGERSRGGGADRAPIAARTSQPAGTTKNLVIGEDAQCRHDESAVERSHRERRAIDTEQLFESLQLPFVVAQDGGRRRSRDDSPQPLQIAIHMIGRREWESLLGLGVRDGDPRQTGEAAAPGVGVQQQVIARWRLLTHASRHLQVMRGVRPGTLDFALGRRFLIDNDQGVGGQEVQEIPPLGRRRRRAGLEITSLRFSTHRQYRDAIQRFTRTLGVEVEAAHRSDFVAPPFDPRRRSHPEPVDVEDPTTDAVLRDFRDRRHPRVPHRIESLRRIREPAFFLTDFDHQPRSLERHRDGSSLGARTRRRDKNSHAAA